MLGISSSNNSHGGCSRTSVAKEKSVQALKLSTKVKSIRGMMNNDPYQLGDSSHHHGGERARYIDDLETDIDDTDIDETERSFEDDTDESCKEHDAAAAVTKLSLNKAVSLLQGPSSGSLGSTGKPKTGKGGMNASERSKASKASSTGSPTRASTTTNSSYELREHAALAEGETREKKPKAGKGRERRASFQIPTEGDEEKDETAAEEKKAKPGKGRQRRASFQIPTEDDEETDESECSSASERRCKDRMSRSEHPSSRLSSRKEELLLCRSERKTSSRKENVMTSQSEHQGSRRKGEAYSRKGKSGDKDDTGAKKLVMGESSQRSSRSTDKDTIGCSKRSTSSGETRSSKSSSRKSNGTKKLQRKKSFDTLPDDTEKSATKRLQRKKSSEALMDETEKSATKKSGTKKLQRKKSSEALLDETEKSATKKLQRKKSSEALLDETEKSVTKKLQRKSSRDNLSDDQENCVAWQRRESDRPMNNNSTRSRRSQASGKSLSRGSNHGEDMSGGKKENEGRSKGRRAKNSTKSLVDGGSSHDKSIKSDATNSSGSGRIMQSAEDRRDAVSKNRSQFVNQKSCKVGAISRRNRWSTMKAVPEPMVGVGHSHSGSISSLTVSTGIGSKDDFSLPSPGVGSFGNVNSVPSRWQALPKGSAVSNSTDGIPTRPEQDLSSLCSPGVLTSSPAVVANIVSGKQMQNTTTERPTNPATSSSVPSLSRPEKTPHSSGNKNFPEVVPATPTASAGAISDLTNSFSISALETPGSNHLKQSMHSKSKHGSSKCALSTIDDRVDTPGGFVSELTTTPCIMAKEKASIMRSGLMQETYGVPVTPTVTGGMGSLSELDTPGGVVSELTCGSSLFSPESGMSASRKSTGGLGSWIQSVMLHESEYIRDGIPKMVRRHSLDSVSQANEDTREDHVPQTHSNVKDSDFAPKAPARRMSLASTAP